MPIAMSKSVINIFEQNVDITKIEDFLWPFQKQIFKAVGNKVLAGPFKGMEVSDYSPWKDCSAIRKLYGDYELELYGAVEKIISRKPWTIVNVGCASGYYAIGFARRLSGVFVHAFDLDDRSLDWCGRMAAANDVMPRMKLDKGCVRPEELSVRHDGLCAYFLDCEGAEYELLDPEKCPRLLTSDIVVEYHDFIVGEGSYKSLVETFSPTHEVEHIRPEESPVVTFGVQYPKLPEGVDPQGQPSYCVNITDNRPETTGWLACWAKNHG
jgi:hypothetical protein